MTKEQAKALIQKYNAGQASQQERHLVEDWYAQFATAANSGLSEQDHNNLTAQIWARLPAQSKTPHRRPPRKTIKLWTRLGLTASIALVAGLVYLNHKPRHSAPKQQVQNQIKPGGNKAWLTLSSGKRIALNQAANGTLAQEAGVQITKTADGQIVYTQSGQAGSKQYNTIETPKGGTYQLRLPDGSRVWLNAASKLTYPLAFVCPAGRKVELSGEAYFEVAKDKKHPFKVKTGHQQVEVLGTHFNVSNYADEQQAKTTLLEGLVRIRLSMETAAFITEKSTLLQPGEQAVVGTLPGAFDYNIHKVDPLESVDWKNGQFAFSNESLGSIMRKLARWYDISIHYQAPLQNVKFSGAISRFDNANKVLDLLQTTGKVHFNIQGKNVTVSN
jgi:ferric-dicitrate binding protein FerR (iron transport regulator)